VSISNQPTSPSASLRCEILSTGDEVLTGQIADTNAAFLADQLGSLGLEVVRHTTVGDDRATLADAFRALGARADVVLCTGGLGPTIDDLTTEVAADVLGVGFRLDEPALARMESLWRRRGLAMPENNRKQAMLPEPAEVLANPIGTAPGFAVKIDRAWFFFMPGVPREMKRMFAEQVVPRVQALRGEATVFEVRVLRSFGLTESATDQALAGLEAQFPGVKLGFRAHFPEIQIKLTVKGPDVAEARARLDAATAEVLRRVGTRVFSDSAPLEQVVGEKLRAHGATLATAESCTGGLVAEMITRVPGSSEYFDRSFVTYSNRAKVEMLGVDEAILIEHGAVSEPTARAMAEGARARAGTTYAVALTGIAGPGGGTADKPVGLVWVALAGPDGTAVRRLDIPFQREQVRGLSAMAALEMLRRALSDLPVVEGGGSWTPP
jgi:nicotinamide-nucleotide amidase